MRTKRHLIQPVKGREPKKEETMWKSETENGHHSTPHEDASMRGARSTEKVGVAAE